MAFPIRSLLKGLRPMASQSTLAVLHSAPGPGNLAAAIGEGNKGRVRHGLKVWKVWWACRSALGRFNIKETDGAPPVGRLVQYDIH